MKLINKNFIGLITFVCLLFAVGSASAQVCITDRFNGSLDSNFWIVSGVGYTPQIVSPPTVSSRRLRLTDNAGNRSTYSQLRRWFPAANNNVVIEFDYYGWGGNGADGVAVVFSDAGVSPSAGGFGGSLGYANRDGSNGFGGGWLGIGLDEFGNFPTSNEGRRGYPTGYTLPTGSIAAGFYRNSVAVRGSGVGQNSGYALLANTGTLATPVTTGANATDSTTKHRYRITLDLTNSINAFVTVERDTSGGTAYTTLIPRFDVRAPNSGQVIIPTNLMLSFTASTGGATNNHEIGNVRICATAINNVGNSVAAQNFECMDGSLPESSYNNRQTSPSSRNPIYTKLSSAAFNLRIVPLNSSGGIETNYIPAGGNSKNLTVELFNANTATACNAYSAGLVATQTTTLVSGGATTTGNFTVNNASTRLICRVTDASVPSTPVYGCSSDSFAVRPQQLNITSPVLTNALLTGSPTAVAGTAFTLDANAGVTNGYTGTPVINTALARDHLNVVIAPGTLTGTFSAGAGPRATGTAFRYQDVGSLKFLADAVLDTGFTAVDQVGDCVAGSSSNVLVGGRYGCNIGSAASPTWGRWVPSHYSFAGTLASTCTAGGLSLMDQDAMGVLLTLKAHASTGAAAASTDPVVSRYTAGYTNLAPVTISGDNGGVGVAVTRLGSPSFPLMPNAALWTTGQFTINDTFAFAKLTTPDGPYDTFRLKAALTDPDGGLLLAANTAQTNATQVRNGRVRLANAYGSELLDLPVQMRSEYWNAGGWVLNTADVCTDATLAFTAVTAPDITPQTCVWDTGSAPGNSAKGCTVPIVVPARQYREAGVAGFAGDFNVWLRAPGSANRGSIDITATVPAWLQFNWTSATASNPKSRATFGSYRNPLIYRRENY